MFPTVENPCYPGYRVRLLADSVNADTGDRISSFEFTYPRFIHAELMTHRLFSRNAASSRAIPVHKLIKRIEQTPVMPVWWGKNQSGMQAQEELQGDDKGEAIHQWLLACASALHYAKRMRGLGVHKQIANRVLEPWMFITVIVTATEWRNFEYQRNTWPNPRTPPGPAQPELAVIARWWHDLYYSCKPETRRHGEWHLPLVELSDRHNPLYVGDHELAKVFGEEYPWTEGWRWWRCMALISTARCARVSYLNHDGERDLSADAALARKLETSGHWSPFEHAARAMSGSVRSGNFFGWHQFRKTYNNEHKGRRLD